MLEQLMPLVHVMAEMVRPRPDHRHIFVYDLLLDEDLLWKVCPKAEFVITARLLGRRWIANSDGVPTLEPYPHSCVYGAVWAIPESNLADFDAHFRSPDSAERRGAFARGPRREMVPVEFYVARDRRHGAAAIPTVLRMLALTRQWGFPQRYTDKIETWAPSSSVKTDAGAA